MKAQTLVWGFAALLCALPVMAQDIPPGDDVWDSLGGGASEVTLSSADWKALCGVTVGDTAVQLKGYNLPGQGTGDTIVTRLDTASFATSRSATVKIRLKDLSFVNDGSHPCSPLTIRVSEDVSQNNGTMTITRTSSAGGTFTAKVPVNAVIESVDASGNVKGTTFVSGVLGDDGSSPWSYAPATGVATRVAANSWNPGVDPVTKKAVRVCRIGNKILPARHCYQPPPPCPHPIPVPTASTDAAVAIEPCFISTSPVDTNPQ